MTSRALGVLSALLFSMVVAAGATGCKKSESQATKLPPATGEGSPPAAKLPEIVKDAPMPTAQTGNERTTGTTYAREEAKLGPKMSGVVTKIWVKEGDVVKKGDPLFQLDARAISLGREQAAAGLRSADVNLRATQVEYDRTKALLDQNAVNRAQFDQIQARLDGAKVMVEQARVGVSQANQMLADAVVRSPMTGIVVAKLVSEGETATMMPPTVVLVVQDQSSLELRFRMPEKVLAEIKQGSRLTATFGSLGVTREAEVVRVSASVEQHTRTVEIFAVLPNKDGVLRPGMLANVEMVGITSSQATPAPVEQAAPTAAAAPSVAPAPTPAPPAEARGEAKLGAGK